MSRALPPEMTRVLERGSFCSIAVPTRRGPHLTPLVFAFSGNRIWLTTSRGSVKARAWRADHRAGGMVREGDSAVCFTGTVRPHDALDPETWADSLLSAPSLGLASVRFTRKNARFFAGYAVDASRVPLAWTPPGRLFVEIRPEAAALVREGAVEDIWGEWEDGLSGGETFRALRKGEDALAGLPPDVAGRIGRGGLAALAVEGASGPVVLPVGWAAEGAALYAALRAEVAALAGLESAETAESGAGVALALDRASRWRARDMVGLMAAGRGDFFALDGLRSGAGSAAKIAARAGGEVAGGALVRIVPERLVWWRGFSSGTVGRR